MLQLVNHIPRTSGASNSYQMKGSETRHETKKQRVASKRRTETATRTVQKRTIVDEKLEKQSVKEEGKRVEYNYVFMVLPRTRR